MLTGININTGGNVQLTNDLVNMKQPLEYMHDIIDNIIPLLKHINSIFTISYIQYAVRIALLLWFIFRLLDNK